VAAGGGEAGGMLSAQRLGQGVVVEAVRGVAVVAADFLPVGPDREQQLPVGDDPDGKDGPGQPGREPLPTPTTPRRPEATVPAPDAATAITQPAAGGATQPENRTSRSAVSTSAPAARATTAAYV
jgi:hypothetical protein